MSAAAPKSADRIFLLLIAVLVVFGLVMLASASSPVGYARFGDTYYFIKKQLLFGLTSGVVLFFLFGHLNYRVWQKLAGVVYLLILILLALVFVPGIGLAINNSRSWVQFFGLSTQPVEFAKLAIIIILAKLLSDGRDLKDWKNGLAPVLAVLSPALLLVGMQPDVGTLSILIVIIFAMLYAAGTPKIYLVVLGLAVAILFTLFLVVAPYRLNRLTTFLHPELDPKGIGYQINQAFLAVGSGGIWGLGLGHSRQKFQYLPEVQADSIFAIVAEETGFIISVGVIILISLIGLRGLKIARGSPDEFGRLLVCGIMVWFVWQSFLNIGAIIGLMPLTGVPLPFISHGGSALLAGLSAVGIVVSVSKFGK